MDLVWLMMQRGQRLDCFTCATVLSACATVATLERGLEVHGCAIRACLESDVVIGSALVDMYSKCGRIDQCIEIFLFDASEKFVFLELNDIRLWRQCFEAFHTNEAQCSITRSHYPCRGDVCL